MKHIRVGALAVAAHVIGAGCSGDGGVDIIHVQQPEWYVWYQAALLALFLYVPVGPLLAFRAADARLAAALPLIGGTALTSFSLFTALEGLSAIGSSAGRATVAAALAESMFPTGLGAAISVVTSLAIGMVATKKGLSPTRTSSGSIVLACSAVAAVCLVGLMMHVWTSAGEAEYALAWVAPVPLGLSLLTVSAAVLSALGLHRQDSRPASPRWFWLFALFSAAAGGLVFFSAERLTAIAAGRVA